jgi:hypothetical protein
MTQNKVRTTKATTVKAAKSSTDAPSRAKVKDGRFLGVPLTTPKQIERTTFSTRRAKAAANGKS